MLYFKIDVHRFVLVPALKVSLVSLLSQFLKRREIEETRDQESYINRECISPVHLSTYRDFELYIQCNQGKHRVC